jgi:hypothetical protein
MDTVTPIEKKPPALCGGVSIWNETYFSFFKIKKRPTQLMSGLS